MEETQKNWVTHQNGWKLHLKYCPQVKTKEVVGGSGLGLQKGRREFTRRWKSKCLVYMDTEYSLISKVCLNLPTTQVHTLGRYAWWSLGQAFHLNVFRQLGESQKVLPESFGPSLFSAWNNPQAKETFWDSKFCSPIHKIINYFSKEGKIGSWSYIIHKKYIFKMLYVKCTKIILHLKTRKVPSHLR